MHNCTYIIWSKIKLNRLRALILIDILFECFLVSNVVYHTLYIAYEGRKMYYLLSLYYLHFFLPTTIYSVNIMSMHTKYGAREQQEYNI